MKKQISHIRTQVSFLFFKDKYKNFVLKIDIKTNCLKKKTNVKKISVYPGYDHSFQVKGR